MGVSGVPVRSVEAGRTVADPEGCPVEFCEANLAALADAVEGLAQVDARNFRALLLMNLCDVVEPEVFSEVLSQVIVQGDMIQAARAGVLR